MAEIRDQGRPGIRQRQPAPRRSGGGRGSSDAREAWIDARRLRRPASRSGRLWPATHDRRLQAAIADPASGADAMPARRPRRRASRPRVAPPSERGRRRCPAARGRIRRGARLVRARNHRRVCRPRPSASPRPKPPPPITAAPPGPTTPGAPTAPRSPALPTGAPRTARRRCRPRPRRLPRFSRPRRAAGLAVNTLRLRHAALALSASVGRLSAADRVAAGIATFAGIRRAHRRPLRKKTALVLDPLRAAFGRSPTVCPGGAIAR